MHYHKVHHPANFRFPERFDPSTGAFQDDPRRLTAHLHHLGNDVHKLTLTRDGWSGRVSLATLTPPTPSPQSPTSLPAHHTVTLTPAGGLHIAAHGTTILAPDPKGCIGVCENAWMLRFAEDPTLRFYGLGSKWLGFELSHKRTKFWNTDLLADFYWHLALHDHPDPLYVTIPYLIIKKGNLYAGILIDEPRAPFVSTMPNRLPREPNAPGQWEASELFLGSIDGPADLYVIVGPTLADLTTKLQRLVGTTPTPPLWALGHHQCRWGYKGYKDLAELDRLFDEHEIPNDGLWLDIDYMRGYRVFTFDNAAFENPPAQIAALQKRGRRVVAIVDPGVKLDPDYHVFTSGTHANAFCKTPEGTDFVGFVWPGATVFPDFSSPIARQWWTNHFAQWITESGINAAWLDMNDPAAGKVELSPMRFAGPNNTPAAHPHEDFHNQYALGMAIASREALLRARPDERPFLLTRSASTGITRHAAVWTGDNVSSTHHLKLALSTSLNLALSGVPFNGPDVPGFLHDATPELTRAWYKAGFLMPFLRNHSCAGTKRQEPWAFDHHTLDVVRACIRLRYKLLPYLYALFAHHEATGDAIIRPLLHDFEDTPEQPLDRWGAAYMLGPAILHSPVLDETAEWCEVLLPPARWYNAAEARWMDGGMTHWQHSPAAVGPATPLFVREGHIIPMRPGTPTHHITDLADLELHVFLTKDSPTTAAGSLIHDDGISLAYQRGERTHLALHARAENDTLVLDIRPIATGHGPTRVRVFTYARFHSVRLQGPLVPNHLAELTLAEAPWTFAGGRATPLATGHVILG